MAEDIRLRARAVDGLTEVRALVLHPMETGLRKDAAGAYVPAHYITQLRVAHGARTVLQARLSLAVSKDPLLHFRFRGAAPGDTLTLSWTDNLGRQRSSQTLIT